MAMAERITRAELSDDLRHYEYDCSVDVLAAVGMATASINPAYLAIYRLKFNNDVASKDTVKQVFTVWAYNSMSRRGMPTQSATRVAAQAMQKWLFDVCQVCGGTGYPVIIGTPSLSAKPCPSCGGSGRQRLHASPDMKDVIQDIFEHAEIAVASVLRNTKKRLGDD